jgi:hypothetical protein
MFPNKSHALTGLLERPGPSLWEQFWASPCIFLGQRLYAATRPVMAPGESVVDGPAVTVVCVSDTHNTKPELPDGDLLIHAGDLTQSGTFEELQRAIDWLRSQPHRHKIVVAGNHDLLLDAALKKSHQTEQAQNQDRNGLQGHDNSRREDLDWGDIIYLQDSSTTVTCINGRRLRLYGSPRSIRNGNWAFQNPRSEDVWTNVIPQDTDILITHGPPRAHLDLLNMGCDHLLDELSRVRPALHVFGHVHDGYGQEWLHYDGVQRAFEKLVIARGGMLNLWRVVTEAALRCFRKPTRASATLLVNPSAVGGWRNDQRRQPIVVAI